jgi:TonB-dependent starch-binding outer membrane protein SusC
MKKKLKFCYFWQYQKSIKLLRIMKISFFLLLIVILPVTANSYAQNQTFNFSEQGITIREIFKQIESKSNFRFFYNDQVANIDQKVNLNAENKDISNILDELFQGTNLTYKVLENNLIVISSKALLQQQKVTGRITDATTGEALPGVNIIIENTTAGAVSDINGNYTIDISNPEVTLVFSFIGYLSEKIQVQGKTKIDVSLSPDVKALDEIVVVGYGKNSRKVLTSSISSVKSEDLAKGAISDVGQLIQGKVAGLNISSSGDPNKSAAVVLRGASTVNSPQGPFYVIDGVPGADISTVAPADIETVDVLKDAAATAIYGNKAANGVIMVTTKRGKKGQMQVSYSGYYGVEKVSSKLNLMNSQQLRDFLAKNNSAFSPNDDLGADTDWQDVIERSTATSQNHNLSFSGGTDHNTYCASINYFDKQGILTRSALNRTIIRLSVEQKAFNDNVKFGLNVANSLTNSTYVPLQNIVLLQMTKHLPVSPVRNVNGSYFENTNTQQYYNPLAMIDHAQDKTKYNGIVGNFTTEVKLPFGLTYNLNIAYQNMTSLHGEFYDSYYSNYPTAGFYNNPDPGVGVSKYLIGGLFGVNGSAFRNTYQSTNKTLETYITWDKKFKDHSIVAVIGYSYQQNISGDGFQASSTNFPSDNVGYYNLGLGSPYSISNYVIDLGGDTYEETKFISDFARLNYGFKDKYLLQASIRRDGSSVFGTNKEWGYFPSIGLAWRVDQESFMKNQTLFSSLKLRASYGVTGNSFGFGAYTAKLLYGKTGTYYSNGVMVASYGPKQGANPDLKWEETATTNFGLDFGFMNDKITGFVDIYDKNTTGMIFDYSVDAALVPGGAIWANGGNINNKGIEITINATPISTNDFTWTSSLNLAHNVNKITSLINPITNLEDSTRYSDPEGSGQTNSTLQLLKKDLPLGQFLTLQYAGKDAGGLSQFVAGDGTLTTSPNISTDYHYAGSPQPKLLLGWTNNFRYKRLDLSLFFRGVFGNKIFNATRADLFNVAVAATNNISADAANESMKDTRAGNYSDRFIEDGSYLRLDNATLGYTFDAAKLKLKQLRVYITANNLFVITGYKGLDPEVNQGGASLGVDYNNFYPKTRTFMFGVNVTF